ncbi:MAG: hypothetical protein GY832_26520 [Chloroflexi bacterium]|nr:hypothetical protein [Chloroflexota bacterium]
MFGSDALSCYMVPLDFAALVVPGVPGVADNVARHADDVGAVPRYLGFDRSYGHRWSDGGQMYGRLSPDHVEELKRIAAEHGEDIHIVGGWAETEQGVANRIAAYNTYGKKRLAPEYGFVDEWQYGPRTKNLKYRNTGAPKSGLPGKNADLDIWTPRDRGRFTGPSPGVRQDLQSLFGVGGIDNYNRYWGYTEPPGTLTFRPDGTTNRIVAPWQLPPRR